MSGLTYSAPPAQVTLRIIFGSSEPPLVERMLRWFNLEHCLTSDPQKMLLPLQLGKSEEVEPGPSTLEDFRIDWEQHFRDDKDYMVYIRAALS